MLSIAVLAKARVGWAQPIAFSAGFATQDMGSEILAYIGSPELEHLIPGIGFQVRRKAGRGRGGG